MLFTFVEITIKKVLKMHSVNDIIMSIKKIITNFITLGWEEGQFFSMLYKIPRTKKNDPIPWYTYPAIDFFNTIDWSKVIAFEFGSGNSTIFWAKHVKKLITVEDNVGWYETILSKIPDNVTYILEKNKNKYPTSINTSNNDFDLIIIDGINRYKCALEAVKKINKNGIIILDNSDWHDQTSDFLRKNGFQQIDFFGFGPINDYKWCTSIFLRAETNILKKNSQNIIQIAGTIKQREII